MVEQGFDFGQQIDDGNLYQLAESGLEFDLPSLGTGHYRLTPWHSRILDRSGWGVGFNFDQELFHPDVIGFFRFGIGERSVTPRATVTRPRRRRAAPSSQQQQLKNKAY